MKIQGTDKYLNDLFYVGPLYHEIFTNLEKLIFLDVGKNWFFFHFDDGNKENHFIDHFHFIRSWILQRREAAVQTICSIRQPTTYWGEEFFASLYV